jgi:uncharacterized membrane protein YphA (DoxX/SURF4 family)
MKIAVLIARILLGLVFVVFGLNKFLQFIPTGPLPGGLAGQFVGALFQSHFLWVVAVIEIVGGILLLTNQYVPLALTLLGPIVVNIVLYHLFLFPGGLPIALILAVVWFVVFWGVRSAFAGIFQQRVAD